MQTIFPISRFCDNYRVKWSRVLYGDICKHRWGDARVIGLLAVLVVLTVLAVFVVLVVLTVLAVFVVLAL